MAANTGSGFRRGSVSDRSQTQNPRNGSWMKRDRGTGKFMAGKASPWRGVAKEPDGRRR